MSGPPGEPGNEPLPQPGVTPSEAPGPTQLTKDEARALYPDLAAAIDADDAPFEMLFHGYAALRISPLGPRAAAHRALGMDVRLAFQRRNGRIVNEYWCARVLGCVVITERGALHYIVNWEDSDADVAEFIRQCENLEVNARRLPRNDRGTCAELIYTAYSEALDIMDHRHATPDGSTAASLQVLGRQVNDAREYLARAALRQAHIEYLKGMTVGLSVLTVLLFVVLLNSDRLQGVMTEFPGARLPLLLATLAAGAAGAVVSVMTRWSDGSLRLSTEADVRQVQILGAFRPLIGSILGGAIYVLAVGGILPLRLPEDVATQRNFILGMTFLAGFSERVASDMLRAPRASVDPRP